ncbi:MAG: serine hydrolase domain-containing protein [Fimbriimonadaceae bacterium]
MTPSDQLDAWVRAQMATWRIPGLVVGVYRNGEPEHVAAYGLADLEHGVPMKRESLLEICSITKQFTAACLLLLQEDGKLRLSDGIGRYVSHMPAVWRDATLMELLNHTSGISDDKFDFGEPVLTEELLARFATAAFRRRGEAWEYSNLAYRLLGDVVANVSDQPFFDFLFTRILAPCGLEHTRPNSSEVIPNRVHGYGLSGEALVNAPMLTDKAGAAAGGLISTVDDLNRWSSALMNGEILSPDSRVAMLKPGALASGDVARPPWCPGGYGLGVNVYSIGGHRVEKHAGGWDDASAQLTRLPDGGLTVAILTNFGGWGLRAWAGEMVASMFVPEFRVPEFRPQADPKPARLATLAAALKEVLTNALTNAHVSPRLHAHLNLDLKAWREELTGIVGTAVLFVQRVPQGARDVMIYRHEGDKPRLVVAGFAVDGKMDSLAVGPIPE